MDQRTGTSVGEIVRHSVSVTGQDHQDLFSIYTKIAIPTLFTHIYH